METGNNTNTGRLVFKTKPNSTVKPLTLITRKCRPFSKFMRLCQPCATETLSAYCKRAVTDYLVPLPLYTTYLHNLHETACHKRTLTRNFGRVATTVCKWKEGSPNAVSCLVLLLLEGCVDKISGWSGFNKHWISFKFLFKCNRTSSNSITRLVISPTLLYKFSEHKANEFGNN